MTIALRPLRPVLPEPWHIRYSDDQPRDEGGRFGEGGGSSGGGDDDDGGSSEPEPDEYNDGLSDSYLEKYGGVKDHYAEDSNHAVIKPERGRMHIADDSHGRENREVLQEVTPSQAKALGNDVYEVSQGIGVGRDSAAGIRVEPGGGIEPGEADWTGAVDVTWSSGRTSSYSNDEAFELQEGLDIMVDSGARSALRPLPWRLRSQLDLALKMEDQNG